jgi:hypothetical protein
MDSLAVAPSLPSLEEIELADHKVCSFTSDLNELRSALERCDGDVVTIEEYVYRQAEGFEHPAGPPRDYDTNRLARIVVFATEVLRDLDLIKTDAEAIQEAALRLHREHGFDHVAHRARVRAWHRAELAEGGQD